jgi:tetratricopeptide (TPR) repeat protein
MTKKTDASPDFFSNCKDNLPGTRSMRTNSKYEMNTQVQNFDLRLRGVLLFLCLAFCPAFSQNLELIQDLKQKLAGTSGKTKVDLLNELAWEHRSAYPNDAIRYANEALALGRSLALPEGVATSLNYIGLSNHYKGNYIRAYEFYDQALKEATTHRDSAQLAHANNNMGRLLSEQGMLTQSYPHFVKAQVLFEGIHDTSGLAYVYQSFGTLYRMQKDYVKSELNFQKALQIRLASGNARDVMSAMVQLGKLYIEIKQFDDAMLYFQKADSAGNVIHDALGLAEIKILTAEYHLSEDHFERAEKLAAEGIASILSSRNVKLVPRAYLVLGQIHFRKKSYAIAKKYFSIALGVSSQMKYLDLEMQSHYYLWRLSEISHNRADALLHSNQYLVLKDSVNDIDVSQKIAQFQFQLEIERKRQENERLKSVEAENKAVIKQQNLQRGVLAIVVLFISALLFLQWRNAKKRRMINEALVQQRDQIEKQRQEIKHQLSYIEEKHAEALVREEEKKQINIQLFEKIEEISKRNNTLENHLTTLLDFSKSKFINYGNVQDAAKDIARITAESLAIGRVSIWKYHDDRQTIECLACYSFLEKQFKENTVLDLNSVPQYTRAIKTKKIVNAVKARSHQDTQEFTATYLNPLDIHSILDVTFYLDDELGGLVCCEQQGQERAWSPEDIIFAKSVSDIISLTYRSAQRREYEKNIRQQSREIARMNETLEQRVRDRTLELENQNRQLSEYAFINSHLLRSPVSKILGLINLVDINDAVYDKEVMEHLKIACTELDVIVKKITLALDAGEHFDRGLFKS